MTRRLYILVLVLAWPSQAVAGNRALPASEDGAGGVRSERAVALCESSQWGHAYRAGCVDMCTIITMPSLEGSGVDTEAAFAGARERCGEHCYDFCTAQMDRLERARTAGPKEEEVPPSPTPGRDAHGG
ncbi:MAG: hypothetical protein E4H03_04625 [Myxococcales bacterium]|nr:MAG: hypothetical protein E4H03_04625 [Myxococcales bacterium]